MLHCRPLLNHPLHADLLTPATSSMLTASDCTLPFRPDLPLAQLSEGGTYATMSNTAQRLQRSQRHLHVTTVAEAGVTVEGEMALVCGVLGAMENGCIAQCWVRNAAGEWILMMVGRG